MGSQLPRDAHQGLAWEQIPADRTFEELGLDSLAVIRLRAGLNKNTNLRILANALGTDSSVADVMALLRSPASISRSPLRWLRRSGEAPTFVWIHPVGGGISCYRLLAQALPFRSIALEAPALRQQNCVAENDRIARSRLPVAAARAEQLRGRWSSEDGRSVVRWLSRWRCS